VVRRKAKFGITTDHKDIEKAGILNILFTTVIWRHMVDNIYFYIESR
jgi:hypothetical protein